MAEGKWSVVDEDIVINGNISGKGNLRVMGCIEGEITLPGGSLTIEPKGFVEGKITVDSLLVAGEIRGHISATSKAQITPTGKVNGDITTRKMEIQEGAVLNGAYEVLPEGEASK